MGEAIVFYGLSALILGFAVMVISTRDTVHSVLFLVVNFLLVAMLYVLLGGAQTAWGPLVEAATHGAPDVAGAAARALSG